MKSSRFKAFASFLLILGLGDLRPALAQSRAETGTPGCGTDALLNDPSVQTQIAAQEVLIKKMMSRRMLISQSGVETLYTLPVVFHIIHLGEGLGSGTNISDAQIESAVTQLNNEFRKIPGTYGDGAGVDTLIQFVLAKRDPSGLPHSGINRVNGSGVANYSSAGIIGPGGTQGALDASVKGLSTWPKDQYINIWVVSEIDNNGGGSGTQGYATFPTSSSLDGIVIIHTAVGTLGTAKSYTNQGKVLTHEMGHILGLYHTFNATTACGLESDCLSQGDRVCDTPSTIIQTSCSTPACGGTQQVANYMDYTGQTCQNLFTQGQKERMTSTLLASRASLIDSLGGTPVFPLDVTISNVTLPPYLCSSTVIPQVTLLNLGVTTVSSATLRYRVDGGGWMSSVFNGTLVSGASAMVSLPQLPALGMGNHTVEFNVTGPNGGVDQNPSNDSASRAISRSLGSEEINVSFTLDAFGSENTYQIFTGDLMVYRGGPFQNGAQGTVTNGIHCLAPGCHSVKILDTYGDGQSQSSGSYRVLSSNGGTLFSNSGNWGSSQVHSVCIGTNATPTPVPPDSIAPSISISSPSSPFYLSASSAPTIPLGVSATDNVGVTRVDFFRSGTLIGSVSAAPFNFAWDASSTPEGTYLITAKAFDAAGNSSTSPGVSVVIDRSAPTATWSGATHLGVLGTSPLTLSVNASDSGGINRVEFYQNGVLIATDTSAPFGFTLDPASLVSGTYTLSVRVFDQAGNVTLPSSVNVIKAGGPAFPQTAVAGSFLPALPGCFSRAQVEVLIGAIPCSSACSSSLDVNGDGNLNYQDWIPILGSECHE